MVQISDEELLDELERCYEEKNKVTATILNNPDNDYPTQPTYSSRFGSLGDALDKRGLEREKPGKDSEWDKDEIVNTVKEWYDSDKSLNTDILNSEKDLPGTYSIYNHFDTLKELYKACGIYDSIKENRKAYRKRIQTKSYDKKDEEDLIHHLLWLQSEQGDTKTSTINRANGPSDRVYKKVFGSVQAAREQAGLRSSYRENYTDRIGELPNNYDEDADGHIYVLQMRRGAESYYYIGMSTSVKQRLNSHSAGNSIVTLHHRNERGKLSDLELLPITIVRVENMYKDDEENMEEFRDRMKSKEHVVSYEVASGLNTSNILGGVS